MDKRVKQLEARVQENKKIKKDVFLLSFDSSYLSKTARPGNFIHVKINSTILRRPFSIHKIEKNKIYMFFRVRGRGTTILSKSRKGDILDIIGPLGKGFHYERRETRDERRILVAGGIGVAPLLFLAQKLRDTRYDSRTMVLLGAKNKDDILCEKEFTRLGAKVRVTTEDGSKGLKGTITDLLKSMLTTHNPQPTTLYACGPEQMFLEMSKILKKHPKVNCQVSFEQFMGCGLGVCCACTIKTKKGYKKVCKDGPVFNLKEIW